MTRIKRIIAAVIIVPLALLLVAFIVANREMMALRLNPFADAATYWSVNAPVFVFLFVFLALGVVIGSVTTWVGQHKYRKKARRLETVLDQAKG